MDQDLEIKQLKDENQRLRAQLAKLRSVAYRDLATGLWNRRYFEERLEEEFRRLGRSPGCELSILLIDVNNLKLINDTHGHSAGDEALRWVADFLRDNLRQYDVPCRWGGDEFVAILPDTEAIGRRSLVARLLAAAQTENAGKDIPITFAVGGATSTGGNQTIGEIMSQADRHMYHHKQMMKKRAVRWSSLEGRQRHDDFSALEPCAVPSPMTESNSPYRSIISFALL